MKRMITITITNNNNSADKTVKYGNQTYRDWLSTIRRSPIFSRYFSLPLSTYLPHSISLSLHFCPGPPQQNHGYGSFILSGQWVLLLARSACMRRLQAASGPSSFGFQINTGRPGPLPDIRNLQHARRCTTSASAR